MRAPTTIKQHCIRSLQRSRSLRHIQTWLQNRTGNRPYRRMNITATTPPGPNTDYWLIREHSAVKSSLLTKEEDTPAKVCLSVKTYLKGYLRATATYFEVRLLITPGVVLYVAASSKMLAIPEIAQLAFFYTTRVSVTHQYWSQSRVRLRQAL
jgi:hypothetical protein